MSSVTSGSGPICGALGCHDAADVVIGHPTHGELIVCNGCTGGYGVVRDV